MKPAMGERRSQRDGARRALTFGELLRQYRVSAGLTQETLAERAGMSLAAIGKLERGTRLRPHRASLAFLADALGLSSDDRLKLESAASAVRAESNPDFGVRTAINLPTRFSSFVGREQDLITVCELLSAHRFVTLVGAGGIGKTRLAVRAAEWLITEYSDESSFDGVWLVDFSSMHDSGLVVTAFASAIGLDRCQTFDALIAYLRSQTFLLILDNCEHLLDPIAHAAKTIISACSGAQILATSRQALSFEGERVYRVPPLSLPPGDTISASDALKFDAIQLFKDRAEAADSRFALTDSAVPAVAEICRRVDGIALAIELAASRTSALSPSVIAAQLGERFSLLLAEPRPSLPRHKTMRALCDWSYDLLNEHESELFERLSLFVGGFTLDLACALYPEEADGAIIPGLLASLVDKSFVQCDIRAGPRYRLLEPVRQYAREKLCARDEYSRTARSHALALLALAKDFDSRSELIPDRVWDECIERERDNFRAAFHWTFGRDGDRALGQQLAASRVATWSGFASGEVQNWLSAAFAAPCGETSAQLRAELAVSAARAAVHFEGDPEARVKACRHAVAVQQTADLRGVARAQYYLGLALGYMGRHDEAESALREARTAAGSAGTGIEYTLATGALGVACLGTGELEEAREHTSEALRLSEAARCERLATDSRVFLAEIEFVLGSVEEALHLNENAAQFLRSHSDLVRLSITLCNSAAYLIALRRYEEAWSHAREALHQSVAVGSDNAALWALHHITAVAGLWAMQHLAAIAVVADERSGNDTVLRAAASVLGFIDEAIRLRAKRRSYTEQQAYDSAIAVLRERLGKNELSILMNLGKAWQEKRAVSEALALRGADPRG